MGVADALRRSISFTDLASPQQWLVDMFGGIPSNTGVVVNQQTALRNSVVYSCVRVAADTVSTLPLDLVETLPDGSTRVAKENPLYHLWNVRANQEMTALALREVMQGHIETWGNAYAYVEKDKYNQFQGFWPLRPDRTWPQRNPTTKKIEYRTVLPNGAGVTLQADQVLHIPGFGYDGLVGYSPVTLMREAIGMSLAMEEYGARFFSSGAKSSGVVKSTKTLSEPAQKRLREQFESMYYDLSKAHRTMILEEGMDYDNIGIPPEDSQFIESRKFQISDIARVWRIPQHMIGDLDRATNNNIEHMSLEFVIYSLTPRLVRIEKTLNANILTSKEQQTLTFRHDVDELLRGDMKSRYDAYSVGRNGGWLNANMILKKEGENPVEGGDVMWQPVNMMPASLSEAFWKSKQGQGQQQTPKGGKELE